MIWLIADHDRIKYFYLLNLWVTRKLNIAPSGRQRPIYLKFNQREGGWRKSGHYN